MNLPKPSQMKTEATGKIKKKKNLVSVEKIGTQQMNLNPVSMEAPTSTLPTISTKTVGKWPKSPLKDS